MKKSFLLLPVSIAILTACSSNSPAPIENVDGTLSPGVMQPVDNNSSGTWQPEIHQLTNRYNSQQQLNHSLLQHRFNRKLKR